MKKDGRKIRADHLNCISAQIKTFFIKCSFHSGAFIIIVVIMLLNMRAYTSFFINRDKMGEILFFLALLFFSKKSFHLNVDPYMNDSYSSNVVV